MSSKANEEEPQPLQHRIVQSKKELHGWWSGIEHHGMRECTSEQLYVEDMSGRKHARIEYRKKLFGLIKAICKRKRVSLGLGLCMEFEKVVEAGNARFRGLNRDFMTPLKSLDAE